MSVYSTAILAESSLVNYWQHNETSGTSLADSKGTYTMTLTGGFTLSQAGPNGVADVGIAFNGSTGKATATATATLTSPYSVEAWIKTASSTFTGGWLGTRAGGGNAAFRVNTGSVVAGILGTSGGLVDFPAQTWTYADSLWHHVVFTVSSTVSQIWFDGVLITSDTYSSSTMQLWANTIVINIAWAASTSEFWNGNICQVAVYNAILNKGQIRAHYWLGAGVSVPNLLAPSIPTPMVALLGSERSVVLHALCGRYGLTVPIDTISGTPATVGATPPTLVPSPWGFALNFVNGTKQEIFSKTSMVKSEGPWTLAMLARINGAPVIAGGSKAGFISIQNTGTTGLWLSYNNTAGNPIILLKGSTVISSLLYPQWGDWTFYAVTWDGKSIQNFYVYDWETGTFKLSSISEATASGFSGAASFAPSFGPTCGGDTLNSSLFDLSAMAIDNTAWTQADFMRFVRDPFYPLRSPSRLALKFASGAAVGGPVPAALLPAM